MPRGGWFIVAYFVGLALTAIYWLYRFFTAPLRFLKRKKKPSASGSEVQIVPQTTAEAGENPRLETAVPSPVPEPAPKIASPIRPRYYRVRQNPKYVMAEYPDRYELFYERSAGDWQYVRTDYKNYGENQ